MLLPFAFVREELVIPFFLLYFVAESLA